jgi:flagellar biosynthesis anti-sigma factor FlgM
LPNRATGDRLQLTYFHGVRDRLNGFAIDADSSIDEIGEVAMKVDASSLAQTQLPVNDVAARGRAGDLTGTNGAQDDWTSFQSDSVSVQSLTSQALDSPEVRQDTVDALRQSVASGQYQADPTNIAAAISDSEGL